MKTAINIILLVLVVALVYLLTAKPELLINPDKTNTAAEGFSRFYANFRNTLQQGSNRSDFIITLPDSSDELVPQLRRRAQQVLAGDPNWRGPVMRRRFHAGDTVKQILGQYAQQEGLVLFWTLPRDYVIKQFFETNGSLIESMQELAVTINPDFQLQVSAWYCPRSLALVITNLNDPYLQENCIATPRTMPSRR